MATGTPTVSASQGSDGTSLTVAEAVAAEIAGAGVELAFAFPGGGTNLALIAGLRTRGVDTVLARSELGAGLMASTVADITGVPGVLVVGLGPGAASAANAVAHSWLDRSPLVVVADRYSDADARTTGHQLLDHRAMLAPVIKDYVDAAPGDVHAAVARAIRCALEVPRGPVLIEMARDRAGMSASMPPGGHDSAEEAGGAAPAAGDLAAAGQLLGEARRPVILLGEEARRDTHPINLVRIAELLKAPVLSSYKAKGVFPESHPLAAGILTGAAIEAPLLTQADVLLAVGLDPVELLAKQWPFEAPVVAIRRAAQEDKYLDPRVTLSGPFNSVLAQLHNTIGEAESTWTEAEVREQASAMVDRLRAGEGPLPAWRAVEVAQEVAGDARVTVDAGAHMFAATWFWRSERPNRFHISNGLATMGHALPAAIGAALAAPEEPVIAVTGDGGFTINVAELETAARAGAKVIVLVFNDASLSLIRVKQRETGLPRSAVDFMRSDFAIVAKGFGVRGAHAGTEAELRDELRAALSASTSTVIDISIDGEEYEEMHRTIRSG